VPNEIQAGRDPWEGELDHELFVALFATVQEEAGRHITWQIDFYNLAILPVGFRSELAVQHAVPSRAR
jgi:hypothetical protein